MVKKLIIGIIISFMLLSLWAGDLDETLESLSGDAAKSYVSPVVSALGSDLNGGWFHKSPKSKFLGLDFEIGIVGMLTMMGDEDEHFAVTSDFQFNYDQAEMLVEGVNEDIKPYVIEAIMEQEFEVGISGPTVAGPNDEYVLVEFPEQEIVYTDDMGNSGSTMVPGNVIDTGVYGLLDGAGALPMFAPQISIGTVWGTRLTARALPPFDVKDLGEVSYFGGGLQHNIKAWMPLPMPVDVSLAAFMQSLKLGDYVTADGFSAGLNVSKTFGMKMLSVTPYAGYMMEKYSMDFSYEYQLAEEYDPVNIDFSVDGKNENRLTLGASFKLGFSHFNVDYNIGEYNSVTMGLAFAF